MANLTEVRRSVRAAVTELAGKTPALEGLTILQGGQVPLWDVVDQTNTWLQITVSPMDTANSVAGGGYTQNCELRVLIASKLDALEQRAAIADVFIEAWAHRKVGELYAEEFVMTEDDDSARDIQQWYATLIAFNAWFDRR